MKVLEYFDKRCPAVVTVIKKSRENVILYNNNQNNNLFPRMYLQVDERVSPSPITTTLVGLLSSITLCRHRDTASEAHTSGGN